MQPMGVPLSEEHTWDLDMIFGMNEALVLCVLDCVFRLLKVSRGNLDGHMIQENY